MMMPLYRITIRYGSRAQQYHMEDVTAGSLQEAVRAAADVFPPDAGDADLIEVRCQIDPDARSYGRE